MPYDFSDVKLLVAEDSSAMRRILVDMLRSIGFERIYEAKDGKRAWSTFCTYNPDIVLADWFMPEMTGLELTRRIRRDPMSPNRYALIMLVTAYTERYRVQEAIESGVHDFVSKPVRPHDFYRRLYRLVEDDREFIETRQYFGPVSRNAR
jgi:CheY-like chemotaxis protein